MLVTQELPLGSRLSEFPKHSSSLTTILQMTYKRHNQVNNAPIMESPTRNHMFTNMNHIIRDAMMRIYNYIIHFNMLRKNTSTTILLNRIIINHNSDITSIILMSLFMFNHIIKKKFTFHEMNNIERKISGLANLIMDIHNLRKM